MWWLRRWFLVLVPLLILWVCQTMDLKGVYSASTSPYPNQWEASIHRLRTGDLTVQVSSAQRQPVPGAVVKLEQVSHHFEFGTALSTGMFRNTTPLADRVRYLKLVKQLFNAGVHENALKWYATEPVKGQVSYADADRILAWSQANQIKLRGHTLFWEVEKWNQPWLKALNPAELRRAVQQRATQICTRYRDRITEYDVNNEMLHGNFFRSKLGESIVADMFRWCHQADPTARLYVNDFDILNGKDLDRYVNQIRALLDQDVPVGGIGVQGHIREPISADRVQKSLDALAQFGLPIKITEFDAVASSEAEQARILRDVYRVAFAHPAVAGVLMWGFWEGAHWQPAAALYRKNWQPKAAARVYEELVHQHWWTRAEGITNRAGQVDTRAFFGQYRVLIEQGGKRIEQRLNFVPGQQSPYPITIAETTL